MESPLGSFFGVGTMSKVLDTLWKAGGVVIIIIIMLVIAYLVIYYLGFNKKVLLIQKMGGVLRFDIDRGRRDTKKMDFKVLRHRSVLFSFPASTDEYPYGRGTIIPFVVVNGQAVTIKGISDNPHFQPADINIFNQMVARVRINNELTKPKQNFWDKYGKDILIGGMIAVFLVSIILILKQVEKAIEMGRQVVSFSASQTKQVIQSGGWLIFFRPRIKQ